MTMLGHKQSAASCKKIGDGNRGQKRSPEQCQQMSARMTGSKHPMFGKHHTKETKKKMRLARLGKPGHPISKGQKYKISVALSGRTHSAEHRRNQGLSMQGKRFTEAYKAKLSKVRCKLIAEGKVNSPPLSFIHGYFSSKKNNSKLYYASSYELTAFKLLEQMSKVQSFQRCPFSILYQFKGDNHRYMPDILIIYTDGTQEVVEVKPRVFVNDPIVVAKTKAAKVFCSSKGLAFSIWTEDHLSKKAS